MLRTDALTLASTTSFIEIAMVIFMIVFVAIVVWVLLVRPGGFKAASRIPLEDDRVMTPRPTTPSGPAPTAKPKTDEKEPTNV